MYIFTDREFEVLRKYRRGDDLKDEDQEIVRRFSLIGLCYTGLITERHNLRQTARLTPMGLRFLKYEEIDRNWFRRIIHTYLVLHQ